MNPAASSSRVFIDTNIPMYAAGAAHSLKEPCVRVMQLATAHPHIFVTDAEVLQEIIHRYLSVRQWLVGREAFSAFAEVMHGRIEPVYVEDILHAARLANDHPNMSSRDLVHTTVAQRLGVSYIVSADADFDRIPGVTRLAPERVGEWAGALLG